MIFAQLDLNWFSVHGSLEKTCLEQTLQGDTLVTSLPSFSLRVEQFSVPVDITL